MKSASKEEDDLLGGVSSIMARVGFVCVPFIRYPNQAIHMVNTVFSFLANIHQHELYLAAVVNEFREFSVPLSWLQSTFDSVEINDQNILARAWNKGIRKCFSEGCQYVVVSNLDVVFHPQYLENLIHFAEVQAPEPILWSGMPWHSPESLPEAPLTDEVCPEISGSAFLLDRRLFEEVGEYDEQFVPAYHEDSDMLYRIRLAGKKVLATNRSRFYHLDRVTFKEAFQCDDQDFLTDTRNLMDMSMSRYEKKWGGLPGQEVFQVPYDKDKA